jgi:hypothetical protein
LYADILHTSFILMSEAADWRCIQCMVHWTVQVWLAVMHAHL